MFFCFILSLEYQQDADIVLTLFPQPTEQRLFLPYMLTIEYIVICKYFFAINVDFPIQLFTIVVLLNGKKPWQPENEREHIVITFQVNISHCCLILK